MRTIADVIAATGRPGVPLPKPEYKDYFNGCFGESGAGHCFAMMVESMKRHMTDEGYQLALALHAGDFYLSGFGFSGFGLDRNVHVPNVIGLHPRTVVLQDKREWTGRTAGPGFDHREKFTGVNELAKHNDIFRGTVLKDAHSDAPLHVEAATEIGAHFWITYYHSDIVTAQAPYVRKEHLVRTYHSVDKDVVPDFRVMRIGKGILSGAVSSAYPLRSRLALETRHAHKSLHNIDYFQHPGYGRHRCYTPEYLRLLDGYRVAICTSSRYGYAVRKIMEATACGCIVVTDLPSDEVLPEIDGNLIRIDSDTSPSRVDGLVGDLAASWDPARQKEWAERAKRFYDYRALGKKLAADIDTLRRSYNGISN